MATSENAYHDCLEAMYGLRRFGIRLGLETITTILEGLGNPQKNFSAIHIAGTNGKGSVASTLSSILHTAGYKVGLYTSPHLIKFNERICINNHPISDQEVAECCEMVKNIPYGTREPTFFEYTTAMAFYEFSKHKTDWAIIETGMGGRMDATNILNPEACIITNISLEHKSYLGNTIAQITGEKGGIIKPGVPVITGVRQNSAISVLRTIAESKSAPLYLLGDEFRTERNGDGTFTYSGIGHTWGNMRTRLSGSYQIDNAALVLAACEMLIKNKKANLGLEHIREGLSQNRWPGRLEVVSTNPYVLLDGAHNLVAAKNLADFLAQNMEDRHITLVAGILDDKPYAAMLRCLLPVCNKVILTQAKIDRALPPETLEPVAKKLVKDVTLISDVGKAVRYAMETASEKDVVCIAGSLYVVGEAKEELEKSGICPFELKR